MRPFSEQERDAINRALKAAGRELFATHGWKKTGIDELCRAVGIARGSFYLFYPSKDAFFLTLLADAEQAVKAEILPLLDRPHLDGRAALGALLQLCPCLIDRHPLLKFAFADPREPAPWLRTLDGESLEVLVSGDDSMAAMVLELLKTKGLELTMAPKVFAGLLRALVLLPLSRPTIGEAVFDAVRDTMTSALARGLE